MNFDSAKSAFLAILRDKRGCKSDETRRNCENVFCWLFPCL